MIGNYGDQYHTQSFIVGLGQPTLNSYSNEHRIVFEEIRTGNFFERLLRAERELKIINQRLAAMAAGGW